MISSLELRQIIESAFLPMKCVCTITDESLMTVSLFHPQKGHAAFVVDKLPVGELSSSRAIASLVGELKHGFEQKSQSKYPQPIYVHG